MIEISLQHGIPRVILVVFSGRVTLDEVRDDDRFRDLIRSFHGAPFRVLCDFTNTATMAVEVSDSFLRAQSYAVQLGMERDAFACTSPTLWLQFKRIAQESPRADLLGELTFFDTAQEAERYLLSDGDTVSR